MFHDETSATTGLPNFVTSATRRMKNVRLNNWYPMMDTSFINAKTKINKQFNRENFMDLSVVMKRE